MTVFSDTEVIEHIRSKNRSKPFAVVGPSKREPLLVDDEGPIHRKEELDDDALRDGILKRRQ